MVLGRRPGFEAAGGLSICDWMSRVSLVLRDWMDPTRSQTMPEFSVRALTTSFWKWLEVRRLNSDGWGQGKQTNNNKKKKEKTVKSGYIWSNNLDQTNKQKKNDCVMSAKEKARVQRQNRTSSKFDKNSGLKLKAKMVAGETSLSLPVRKSPEISVTCLSRKTKAKHSLEVNSSLNIQEARSDALGSSERETPRSRGTSVCTQGR